MDLIKDGIPIQSLDDRFEFKVKGATNMEFTKGDTAALATIKDPIAKEQVTKRLEQAYKLGNIQCQDCGITSGVWSVTFYNLVNSKTKEVKKVCLGCGIYYVPEEK